MDIQTAVSHEQWDIGSNRLSPEFGTVSEPSKADSEILQWWVRGKVHERILVWQPLSNSILGLPD
jgi:hypothetical protein